MPFRHIALCLLLLIGVCPKNSIAQNSTDTLAKPPKNTPIPELLWKFDSEGNTYLKATVLSQIWLRWNESNPGSLVYGTQMPQTGDIGLRRMRMQLYGKFSKHLFFYMQYGVNNFNYLAQNAGNRKLHAFFHDVVSEYIVTEGKNSTLKIGGGLTIATGLSRFSQPSIGTILTVDVPVFLQTTTDQIDEFSRELGIYARGQYHKWDYRVVLSHPFPIQTNGGSQPTLGQDATFTTTGEHLQCGTLFIYNLADKEPHTTPYMAGTYLGKKKIINIEAGFIYQPKATWSLPQKNDTQY
ncbi:MAG: hypothetical protein EBX41_10005, partial [Chitinophagia bacterium]|nr:hypothetical protein [Chitinophagia bacterium]